MCECRLDYFYNYCVLKCLSQNNVQLYYIILFERIMEISFSYCSIFFYLFVKIIKLSSSTPFIDHKTIVENILRLFLVPTTYDVNIRIFFCSNQTGVEDEKNVINIFELYDFKMNSKYFLSVNK